MGCGCSGSTPQQTATQTSKVTTQQPAPRPGGPGEPGYTWNGPPERRATPAPAPDPVEVP